MKVESLRTFLKNLGLIESVRRDKICYFVKANSCGALARIEKTVSAPSDHFDEEHCILSVSFPQLGNFSTGTQVVYPTLSLMFQKPCTEMTEKQLDGIISAKRLAQELEKKIRKDFIDEL